MREKFFIKTKFDQKILRKKEAKVMIKINSQRFIYENPFLRRRGKQPGRQVLCL